MLKSNIIKKTKFHLFLILSKLSTFLVMLFLATVAYSQQVPMKARDSKSAVNVSDFEKINLSNGNFNFNLPLASIGGRGVENGVLLNIEQKWRMDNVVIGYSNGSPNIETRIDTDPFEIAGIKPQTGGYLVGNTRVIATEEIGYCSGQTIVVASHISFTLNFTSFGGQGFSFVSQENEGQPLTFPIQSGQNACQQRTISVGQIFTSTDGSGTKFIADSSLLTVNSDVGGQMIVPSGVIKTSTGSTYRIDNGLVSWVDDRNGNRTIVTMSGYTLGDSPATSRLISVKDSLNREIQISNVDAQWFQYITFKGIGGTTRTIKIFYDDLSNSLRAGQSIQRLSSLFPATLSYSPYLPDQNVNPKVIKYAELPDGRKYSFKYNSYAELSRVELPTDGAVEYDFETVGANVGGAMDRRITERRVYSNGVNLDNKTQYIYSHSVPSVPNQQMPSETSTTVKVFDNQGITKLVSKTYFYGCIQDGADCVIPGGWYAPESAQKFLSGREFKSEVYASDGTTLLRKTETTFEYRTRANWSPLIAQTPYKDYRVKDITHTLADSMQVSKTTYGYDPAVNFNLQTDVYEYDNAYWQPGNFLRRSHTEYKKDSAYINNSVNLLNLPIESWVSSDINGNNIVSRSKYEYDNYASSTNTAPLTDRSNITGHNLNYGTSYTTRGNLTKVISYADAQNQTGAISTYAQYDIAGNIVKAIDAKNNISTVNFNDNFGLPDAEAQTNSAPLQINGQNTFAFPTSATNALGWIVGYLQVDYYTGATVDAEDINGNVSSIFYNDLLDRPTQVISANNRPNLRSQNTFIYDDANRKATVTADLFKFDDNLLKTESFSDNFGRTVETRNYNDGSYVTSKTEYDALGRAYRQSNPYRPTETVYWTTSEFDAIGRITKVKTPDNAEVITSYAGNSVTVIDQAGKQRRSITNAIGQLTRIDEPDASNNLGTIQSPTQPTNYTYDTLGNLATVNQGVQTRSFIFDSLSRLKSATNPELGNTVGGIHAPGTIQYSYDANGNLLTKIDARDVKTTFAYDGLNRVLSRSYTLSNGNPLPSNLVTPNVTYTYDDENVANSKGNLTKISSSVSITDYTAYDILGRVSNHKQTTDGQIYTTGYVYNLSGALIEQTYPSGRVVKNVLDNDGDLSIVQSKKNANQGFFNYAKNFTYTAAGAASSKQLGNGKWESTSFNSRLQPTQIALGTIQNGTDKLKLNFDYGTTNNNGNVLSQQITVPTETRGGTTYNGFTVTQTYAYDSLNRLKEANEKALGYTQAQCDQNPAQCWKQTFLYDRYGNRNFDMANTTNPSSQGTLPKIVNPEVLASNNRFKLDQDGDLVNDYLYDAAGNLTSDALGKQFTYDAENKQTEVKNASNVSLGTYFYDGDGKRVKKIAGNDTTIFVYDASGKLVAEYANQIATPSEAKVSYLTSDHLGSPRINTDANGAVIARHDYQPFGEEIQRANYGTDDVREKFATYERDNESSLDYAQARYHNYNHGRFTSPDPLMASAIRTNPQTFNRYSYVLNNPINLNDPSGLCPPVDDNPCQIGDKWNDLIWQRHDNGDESWTDPVDDPVIIDGGSASAIGSTPPAAGWLFPTSPPTVTPVIPPTVSPVGPGIPPATVAPGAGRVLLNGAVRAAIITAAAPVALILILSGTAQGPTTQRPPTTTTTLPDKEELDGNLVIVRGGESPLPPPGTIFSGAFGATILDAAAYVPHGQIRTTTIRAILESGGTVVPDPELTRGGNLNERHVNITEGSRSTFSPLILNPVPKANRIQ